MKHTHTNNILLYCIKCFVFDNTISSPQVCMFKILMGKFLNICKILLCRNRDISLVGQLFLLQFYEYQKE